MSANSRIVITLPPDADFMSLARLTSSGVASYCSLDIDAIDDIRVCVSEVLNKVISSPFGESGSALSIIYEVTPAELSISFSGKGLDGESLFIADTDEFAYAILSTLMDRVILSKDENSAVLLVKKLVEGEAG